MPDGEPIAWTAIPPNAPVRCTDGHPIGRVVDVLGSRDEDVFHGVVVELERRRVVVLADEIAAMTTTGLDVVLDCAAMRALPDDEGRGSFHAASGGILGTHFGERERFRPDGRDH